MLEHLLDVETKSFTSAEFQHTLDKDTHAPPYEWFEYNLCKLFNCTPSQLNQEDYQHLLRILVMHNTYMEVEESHRKLDEQMNKGKKKRVEVSKHLTIALELEKIKKQLGIT